jgi:hypothetical protein
VTGPASAAQLRDAFGVSEAEVALNAQGRLSRSQRNWLLKLAAMNTILMLALCGGLLWIVLGVAVHPVEWWRWLLVGVLEAALVYAGVRWIRRLVVPALDGVVVRHSGPVQVGPGRRIVVDGLGYNVQIPLRLVTPGASYDVYVVELPAMVVSMVPTQAPPA